MLHDGKRLIPFVSGEILFPKNFWDQFHLTKKLVGPIPTSKKIVWDYFHPCIPPNNIDMKHNLMLKIKSVKAGQTF